jgi:hypothetical protein
MFTEPSAADDRVLPFHAHRGEGENACVMGPQNEIVVECVHGDPDSQIRLAQRIAAMFNRDLDLVHSGALELLLAGLKPHVTAAFTLAFCRRGRAPADA